MKVNIEIDNNDSKNDYNKAKSIIDILENNNNTPGQQILKPTLPVKKYFCNNPQCKKEITKDVVAYCLHPDNKPRFNGKVYCLECQQKHTGGDAL